MKKKITASDMLRETYGVDIDVALLETIDFLKAQVEILQGVLEKNEVKLNLNDEDRRKLADLGSKLSPKNREKYSYLAEPDTLLFWRRKLIGKIIHSEKGNRMGAPHISDEERELIFQMYRENPHLGSKKDLWGTQEIRI